MTQFSDDLYLGAANFGGNGSYGFPNNGFNGSSLEFSYGGLGVGPMGRTFSYDVVPLTKNATAFAASQSPGSAAIALSAGTGVTAVVCADGTTRYVADVARAVTVTSGGNDTGIAFLIKGHDIYGQSMSQLLTGASGAAATTTKAFYDVVSVTPNGAASSTVTVGTADVFGLPIALTVGSYVGDVGWTSSNVFALDTGTLVLAVATSPATTTTGDVRGTYVPSTASNGANRLVFTQVLSASQSGPSATAAAVMGVQQV